MTDIRLRLDMVDNDGDNLAKLIKEAEGRGVLLTVVTLHGPAGGNPVVDVFGGRGDVALWLLEEYVDWDGTELRALLEPNGPVASR